MVPVPSKNIQSARRYSSSKLDGFRKFRENPQILDRILRVELPKVFKVTRSLILSQPKWSALFVPEDIGAEYELGLRILSAWPYVQNWLPKKLFFENFAFEVLFNGFSMRDATVRSTKTSPNWDIIANDPKRCVLFDATKYRKHKRKYQKLKKPKKHFFWSWFLYQIRSPNSYSAPISRRTKSEASLQK